MSLYCCAFWLPAKHHNCCANPAQSIPRFLLTHICGAQQASAIRPVFLSTLLQVVLQEGPSGRQLPKCAFACPPAPVCRGMQALPAGSSPSEPFLSQRVRGRSTSPERAEGTDTSLRSLFLRRNKSQLIFNMEVTWGTRRFALFQATSSVLKWEGQVWHVS